MRIVVVGMGYVGLSIAVLLAQHNQVTILDLDPKRVENLKLGILPFQDKMILEYFHMKSLNLKAETLGEAAQQAYHNADYIIIATPTDYNPRTNSFDVQSVVTTIQDALLAKTQATLVIKSTVPVGFTQKIANKLQLSKIIFCPEFLREGRALYDNLYPDRIVLGSPINQSNCKEEIDHFAELLQEGALKENIPIVVTHSTEAEAIKLFANTYLASRIAFFNELDTFAEVNNLDSKKIIDGVCYDSRIGDFYNNPSFGYGGYCLPKDTKQLLSNYENVPQELMSAIVATNDTRKNFIAHEICERARMIQATRTRPVTIGIYRLTMKSNSDNFRYSSIKDVLKILATKEFNICIYEPMLEASDFDGIPVTHDLVLFKDMSELIVANRMDPNLSDVKDRVFTRDLFHRD